ncbi:MAG: MATE family efflux transporter, partial [bacterium]|nr:MATE family efflux transporter [bacterium]
MTSFHPAISTNADTELSQKNLRAKVFNLSWPVLVEMLLVSLVSMADMIMVGRIGPAAIASVGLTNQPMFFALAIFMALNVGTTAIVARSIGAGDVATATDTAKQTFVITALMGFLVSILAVWGAPYVLKFMNAGTDVLSIGTIYFRIVGSGLIFTTLAMSAGAVLRGSGDTRTPMRINMIANLVNVVGNYLLIYGKFGFPQLGVAGAAIATTFSRAIACAIFFYVLFNGEKVIRLSLKDKYKYNSALASRVFSVGSAAAMEQFVLRGGQVAFARVVATLGTSTFAAHQIGLNVLSLSFMPGQAFSTAATTLVGQGLGARNPALAEKYGYETKRLGMYVAGFMALLFFIFAPQIAS